MRNHVQGSETSSNSGISSWWAWATGVEEWKQAAAAGVAVAATTTTTSSSLSSSSSSQCSCSPLTSSPPTTNLNGNGGVWPLTTTTTTLFSSDSFASAMQCSAATWSNKSVVWETASDAFSHVVDLADSAIGRVPFGYNLAIVILLAAFDRYCAPRKAKWFAVHSFANLLVVLFSWRGMMASLLDPLYSLDARVYDDRSMFGNASPWPVRVINSLHVYHMLFYRVTDQELFHHLVFVPIIGFAGQYFSWGASLGFMAFFISGLPGLIDYTLLVLVKYKRLDSLTQKRVAAAVNVYLRGPFIIISAHTCWLAMRYEHLTVPKWVCTIILIVSAFNATTYMRISVANHAVSRIVAAVDQVSAGLEAQMPAWRKEADMVQNKIC